MALSTGIIGYWKLDGNSKDAVSTNNGTDVGISYSSSYGKINQGALIGGTGSIIVPDVSALDPASAMTIGFWVYPTGTPQAYEAFVYKSNLLDAGGYYQWGTGTLNATGNL
jgi:hypothetical protein